MDFRTAFKYSVLTAAVLLFGFTAAKAAGVSKDELKKVEKQVLEQSLEHKKLQAQATQINLEISAVNKEMIKTAKKIQNNELSIITIIMFSRKKVKQI